MFLYNYETLKKITQTENGKKMIDGVKAAYEKLYKDVPVVANPYSYFKLIYKNGNRDLYQKLYYDRRKRFSYLQLLALADDAYLEELEDIINVILEEYTWVLPAHCYEKGDEFDYTVIDLFSAETGFYLAETAYVLGDKLSSDVKVRIKAELKRRIIDNYENREQLWYDLENNWAAVCSGSVGITYMYAFPERFAAVKDRIFKTMECYLQGTREEGVTPEGVGYWIYGFGFFTLFFDIYEQYSGEYPELLNREKVVNTIKYIDNACLDGNCYLPYADGGQRETHIHAPIAYAAKRLYGDKFTLPQYMVDGDFTARLSENTGKAISFRVLYGMDKFGLGDEKAQEAKTVYYKESQIFIHKNKDYAFTAKCGTNAEMHNHNDVASFQMVVNGKGIIVDPGPAKYTWQYFNDMKVRYSEEVFAAGSMGHSVPIVNGKYQKTGDEAYGTVLEATDSNFKFDFAPAYEGIDSLVVNYQMQNKSVKVSYDCKGVEESITFRFLSFNEPTVQDGVVSVGGLTLKSVSGMQPNLKTIEYLGHVNQMSMKNCETIYAIDYTVNGKSEVSEEFTFEL